MAETLQGLALGRQYHQAGDLGRAEEAYRQVLRDHGAHTDAHYLLAAVCHSQGKLDEAAVLYREVLQARPAHAEAHTNLGVLLSSRRQYAEAAACFERALQYQPGSAEAQFHLAAALRHQGRLDAAEARYRQALRLRPAYPEAILGLGMTLGTLGRPEEAVASFREAIRLKPDYALAHNNLAVALADLGRQEEAAAAYRRALELNPEFVDAHHNLGIVLRDLGRLEEAAASYREAVRRKPDHAGAHNNLGVVLAELDRPEEAVAAFREAVRCRPDLASAHNNMGIALAQLRRLDEAIASYREALRHEPSFAEAYSNLGNALARAGRMEEALATHAEALRWRADVPDLHSNLGNDFLIQGRHAEALACYERALALNPEYVEAHLHRGLALLLLGRWREGWPEYEWRWRMKNFPKRDFPQPRWDGSPLGGRTILLHAEQGLGDILQFIRYAPLVQERGGRVVVEAPGGLLPLLRTFRGIDVLVAKQAPLPPFDVHAGLLSLPGILGTTVETIPARVPYLAADPERVAQWRKKLAGPEFKVGIAWQGSRTFHWDRYRSIPLAHFAPLGEVAGVRLINLQKGHGSEQLRDAPFAVTDLGDEVDTKTGGFLDTAAIMKCLDLVITSDTAVAHLAGTLGVPVWVALPVSPDWRWLLGRDDCPWYPTMRLFRQRRLADWGEVFERLAVALGEAVRRRATGGAASVTIPPVRQPVRPRSDGANEAFSRGTALLQEGRLEDAAACFRDAVRQRPDHVEAHNSLGYALRGLGHYAEAETEFDRALELRPDHPGAHANRAILRLLLGDYERGWPEYEWRLQCGDITPPPFRKPVWNGGSLQGRTILLHTEQGLGDTIQFARFAPLVKARGGTVLLACPPKLVPLLSGLAGVDRVVPKAHPLPKFEVHASLPSLPSILKIHQAAAIPRQVPYLRADPALVAHWRQELKAYPGFKVGIAWRGSPSYREDRWRSIPLGQFGRLAAVPGVRLFSLQKGAGTEELRDLNGRFEVIDLGSRLDEKTGTLVETAAVLKALDLVIACDTAVNHLAGALGVPAWLPLNLVPDWRWGVQGEDNPWYPTVRLFRQTELGQWEPVFTRMAEALAALDRGRTAARPLLVEVPPGELIDKITILEIKARRIGEAAKLAHVRVELEALTAARDCSLPRSAELDRLTEGLRAVNEVLWDVEDAIRLCERDGDFGERFVELARSVYCHNDRRAALKRQVNELLGSRLIEEKSYADYAR
jgi:tetratricopeptide (TPR) repeat protein